MAEPLGTSLEAHACSTSPQACRLRLPKVGEPLTFLGVPSWSANMIGQTRPHPRARSADRPKAVTVEARQAQILSQVHKGTRMPKRLQPVSCHRVVVALNRVSGNHQTSFTEPCRLSFIYKVVVAY